MVAYDDDDDDDENIGSNDYGVGEDSGGGAVTSTTMPNAIFIVQRNAL